MTDKVWLIRLDRCTDCPSSILFLSVLSQRGYMLMPIIISIFKQDNVFSIIASLSYGPPVNTDIDYYQTLFFPDFYFL